MSTSYEDKRGSDDEDAINSEEDDVERSDSDHSEELLTNSEAENIDDNSDDSNIDKNSSEPEADKNKNSKFENIKLVPASEIKIDVMAKSQIKPDNYLYLPNIISPINKPKTALNLIKEVNLDLDQLFLSLSKTVKTFNKISNNEFSEKEPGNKNNRNKKSFYSDKNEFNNMNDYDSINEKYENNDIYKYNSNQSRRRTDQNKINSIDQRKIYSDKETNTYDMDVRSSRNNSMMNPNNFYYENNINDYSKEHSRGKQSQNNNYIRTVDDLYRPEHSKPIIFANQNYNYQKYNTHDRIAGMNKNYFEADPEAFYDQENEKREKFSQTVRDKRHTRPKDIGQAIDILMGKSN